MAPQKPLSFSLCRPNAPGPQLPTEIPQNQGSVELCPVTESSHVDHPDLVQWHLVRQGQLQDLPSGALQSIPRCGRGMQHVLWILVVQDGCENEHVIQNHEASIAAKCGMHTGLCCFLSVSF